MAGDEPAPAAAAPALVPGGLTMCGLPGAAASLAGAQGGECPRPGAVCVPGQCLGLAAARAARAGARRHLGSVRVYRCAGERRWCTTWCRPWLAAAAAQHVRCCVSELTLGATLGWRRASALLQHGTHCCVTGVGVPPHPPYPLLRCAAPQVESRTFGPLFSERLSIPSPYLMPAVELINHSNQPNADRAREGAAADGGRPPPGSAAGARCVPLPSSQPSPQQLPTRRPAAGPAVEGIYMAVRAKRDVVAGEVRRCLACRAGGRPAPWCRVAHPAISPAPPLLLWVCCGAPYPPQEVTFDYQYGVIHRPDLSLYICETSCAALCWAGCGDAPPCGGALVLPAAPACPAGHGPRVPTPDPPPHPPPAHALLRRVCHPTDPPPALRRGPPHL